MKKKFKALIILTIIMGLFASSGADAFCLSFNWFKKDNRSVENNADAKAADKAKKDAVEKQNKEQKNIVKAKKQARKQNAKAVKKKSKPKKEKYDDSLVKAKTDKNQPAVLQMDTVFPLHVIKNHHLYLVLIQVVMIFLQDLLLQHVLVSY